MNFNKRKIYLFSGLVVISAAIISGCSTSSSQQTHFDPPAQDVEAPAAVEIPASEAQPIYEGNVTVNQEIEPQQLKIESLPLSSPAPGEQPKAGYGGGADFEQPEAELSAADQAPESPAQNLETAPAIGAIAPNFTLQTISGDEVNLHDLRGKAVMVNYWVTWCIPCIEEMPVLEKLHREYQDQGFTMLSVNGIAQDDMDTVMSTLGEFGVTFPVALDQGDSVYNEFQVRFMPTSFFIDKQGVIRHIQLGSTDEEGFRTKIEELLSHEL